MDLTGYLLGNRYEIIEKIGDGGMATVYKAKCRLLNRFVAIKILKEEFINDAEFSKKFATEAQAAASLSHPNIVSIYDVGREGNINYIVMELVEGKTLKQVIQEEGKLHWKKACEIAYQIAQGIEHAHKNHIIHRDIKPHNIIVTPDMKIKVTDFGIAKATSTATITMSGDAVGSVHYFSPEQAKGGVTTEKSDIYSLGVVLYEMLTGILPFMGDTPISVALKHVQENPKMPSDIEITVPYSVNSIVMKAMQKDPNLRYQNASEMALDLSLAISDPTQNHTEIKNYDDFSTQRFETVKIKEETHIDNDKLNQFMNNAKEINNGKIIDLDKVKSNEDKLVSNKSGKKKSRKRRRRLITIVAIILFALAFFAGLFITGIWGRVPDIEVPDLKDMTVEDATKLLEDMGLVLEIDSEMNDQEIPINTIMNQDPKNPMKIKKGNSVKVLVSKGPTEVELPKVTEISESDAIFRLDQLGLKYEIIEETSLEIDKGIVIRQKPEKGEIVKAESTVTLYVSNGVGDGKVKMPSVVNMTEDDAKAKLLEMGLVVKEPIVYKSNKDKVNNLVLSQSIPEGSIVNTGSEVTIEVNKISVSTEYAISNKDISYESGVVKVDVSKMSAETVNIKIFNDSKKILYDKDVSKNSGKVELNIVDTTTDYIEVYIDNNIAARYSL